jgi:ABC-type uncharacterized transport system substrate-binding protein
MIMRTALALALVFGLFVSPLDAAAQRTDKVPRIGYLSTGTPDPSYQTPYRVEPFRRGLRELGYIEGRSVLVEYRYAGANPQRLAELAAELVNLGVDVMVTAATPAALAAKRATSTIPIVMVDPGDPVAAGLVQSMARPGGNATALTSIAPDLAAKRLQLLRELAPQEGRAAILWNSAIPPAEIALRELRETAQALRFQLDLVEVQGRDGLARGLDTLTH